MEKHFEYNFNDQSDRNRISFDCSESQSEQLHAYVEGNEAVIVANCAGFMTLAKLCLQLALGSYKPGFHIHIREDFSGDAAQPDQLRLAITDRRD